jgi:hypothetical protein
LLKFCAQLVGKQNYVSSGTWTVSGRQQVSRSFDVWADLKFLVISFNQPIFDCNSLSGNRDLVLDDAFALGLAKNTGLTTLEYVGRCFLASSLL